MKTAKKKFRNSSLHEKNFQTLALCEILSERPICERKLLWSKTASMYIMNISEFKIIKKKI